MKTAGIAIDHWKLPIFRKHLDKAGYPFTEAAGRTPELVFLKVEFTDIDGLKAVVVAANAECSQVLAPSTLH